MATKKSYTNGDQSWNDYINSVTSGLGTLDKDYWTAEDVNGQLHYSTKSQEAANKIAGNYTEDSTYTNKNGKTYNYYDPMESTDYNSLYSQLQSSVQSNLSDKPTYQSQWTDLANQLSQNYLNSTYADYLNGDEYAALANKYTANGTKAMKDTMAQAAAQTGGLASSYATTAANQSYNDYMSLLEDAAMSAYQNELTNSLNKANLAISNEQNDYNKYLSELSQYNTDRDYQYGLLSDALSQANTNYQNQYQAERDAISDQRYEDETEYSRSQDYINWLKYRAETLAATGNYTGYRSLMKAIGLPYSELQEESFADMNEASAGGSSGSSGGSSGSSSGSSSKPKLTAAQAKAEVDAGNLTDKVIEAYEYYYGDLPVEQTIPSDITANIEKYVGDGTTNNTGTQRGVTYAFNIVNDAYEAGTITEEQADYLVDKYNLDRNL